MEGRRRRIEPGHVGAIAARYLGAEGCRVFRRGEGGFSATCPGCGGETYEVNLGSGKAGCIDESCTVPGDESWVGVVAHFEELDRKDDWDEIRNIAFEIVEEQEQASRLEKAQKEVEERAERAQRDRAGQEAEARRRAQETQERGAGRIAESRAAGKDERGRYAAQDEEERRLLNARRKEKERRRQRRAEREAQEALREARALLEDQHDNDADRAVAAQAPVLWSELRLAVLAGAAVSMATYHGVGWLGSPAGTGAEPAVLGTTAGGGDEAGWFGRLAGEAAAAAAQLVPWRFHVGLLLGLSLGGMVLFLMSRGRRGRHAFYENEYLVVCRPDERRGGRMVRVHQDADLSEISKEPLRRFVGGAGKAVEAVGEALAWAADVLRMADWPWFEMVVSLLFGLLVGWSVFEYLPVSGTAAALAAALAFLVGLAAMTADGNR